MRTQTLIARDWFVARAQSVYARAWLAVLSFTDSCIFLIPPDPLLIALVLAHRSQWLKFSLITIAFSLFGAVFGYLVGAFLYDTIGVHIVALYGLESAMESTVAFLEESVFVFTLTMAFTPIPFKVAVLAAGVAKADFIAFMVASIIGRGARYLLIGYVTKVFGDHSEVLLRKIGWHSALFGAGVLCAYALWSFLI